MFGFLKEEHILDERYDVQDMFNQEKEKDRLREKIDDYPSLCTLGLIGEYGIGKSTLLYQLETEAEDAERWFVFDAWKYPGRLELWENFVIDLAEFLGGKSLEKATKAKINGTSIAKSLLKDINKILPKTTETLFDYYKGKKIYLKDYYNILTDLITNLEKPLFIVLEDIDRSGDHGQYFLETLKFFLFQCHTDKKVLFIVPIATQTFESKKLKDSFLKSLNYTTYYKPQYDNFSDFIEFIIDDSILALDLNSKPRLNQFLKQFCLQYGIHLRELKKIIREANQRYLQLERINTNIDWETTVCLECLNNTTGSSMLRVEDVYRNLEIPGNNLFSTFITAIALDRGSILDYKNEIQLAPKAIKIYDGETDEKHPVKPYVSNDFEGTIYMISTYFK